MSPRLLLPAAAALAAVTGIGYVASLAASGPVPLDVTPPAAPAVVAQAPAGLTPAAQQAAPLVDPAWVASTASAAGLPAPALRAYATAQLRSAAEDPGCHLGWTTLAGLGWVESQHGTFRGRTLGDDGRPSRPILGPLLDGSGAVAAVPGEHGGWARAAGPMQFLPSTWSTWAADGDGDGTADIQDLDDAAYAAARYLCASGDLATGAGWARAVLSYNHSQAYVDQVHAAAQSYADRTG